MAKLLLLLASCICAVVAEPPVNTYLPANTGDGGLSKAIAVPSSSYGVSTSEASQYRSPSAQYGTPSFTNNAPSIQYGAPRTSSVYGATSARVPSASYGTPSSQIEGSVGSLSRQYGATTFRKNAPSAQYGAPRTPSSFYGAPSARVPSASYGTPSSLLEGSVGSQSRQYGATTFRNNAPSAQYGAPRTPSSVYGTPSARVPSSSYGTPATRYSGVTNDAIITDAADLGQGGYGQSGSGNAYGAGEYGQSGSGTGYGQGSYDDQSVPAKYDFNYEVNAPEYNVEFGHQESRDGDNTQGSYHVLLPDGRRQLVEYTADLEGYKPRISYQDTGNAFGAGNYGSAGAYGGSSAGGYDSGSASGYSAPGSSGAAGYSASRNQGGYPISDTGSGPY